MSKLRVLGLRKAYQKAEVIRGIDLEVSSGESVALLGPNGAGKTTCFYMIVGIVKSDAGQIFLDEYEISSLPIYIRAKLGIGYLPQEPSIFRGLTVEDNILAMLEAICEEKDERYERLNNLLLEFKIEHLRKSLAISLSGGERRRLEIARCIAMNPRFILLDEPFSGVDPIAISDVMTIITNLKDRGIGVLITDHNVRETLKIVDRAYIIYDGAVLVHGKAEEIITNEFARKYYLGSNFD